MTERTNAHPADELYNIREEIKHLEARADELRNTLLHATLEERTGDFYVAQITPNKRETLDRKALTEAFGEAAVAPYVKATTYNTIKLVGKK